MNRSALRNLLRNLLAASLPLAAASCSDAIPAAPTTDMSRVAAADLSAMTPPDASVVPDLAAPVADLAMVRGDGPGFDLHGCPPLPAPSPCEFDVYQTGPIHSPPMNNECVEHCKDVNTVSCFPVAGPCAKVHCFTCAIGRRPASLVEAEPPPAGDEVGRFFASVAHLEAASVDAFEELARDLAALGAPAPLIDQAERAASDERRHARVTAIQARRFGAEPATPDVPPAAPRGLEALARDNAVEGCVRETFGALVAGWQARAAGDPAIRDMMTEIAEDETRHAELSWSIARWAEPRLDPAARARITLARRAAALSLIEESQSAPPVELVHVAGLPVAAQALFLAQGMVAALGLQ